MFEKRNLFAVLALTASIGTAAYAQDKKTPALPEVIERRVQIFTNDTGESYLGVKLQEITKENFAGFRLKEIRGAAVTEVAENSPAKRAGLNVGDVIVKFDGEEIKSIRKLMRLISEVAPDHSAKITIFRSGSEKDLTAVIGKRSVPQFQNAGVLEQIYGLPGIPEFPSAERMPSVIIPPGQTVVPDVTVTPSKSEKGAFGSFILMTAGMRRTGISVMKPTKQLGEYFGTADGAGLLIRNVNENSPGAKAGLKAGDVIIEADGKPVTARDFGINFGNKDKISVVLTIIRNKNRQTITVELPEIKEESLKLQVAPNS